MDSLRGFAERTRHDVPLAELTWFGLGGCARHMICPRSVDDLRGILEAATEAQAPLKVLGDGAIPKPMTIFAHAFSKSAREKIAKAGGTINALGGRKPAPSKPAKAAKKEEPKPS